MQPRKKSSHPDEKGINDGMSLLMEHLPQALRQFSLEEPEIFCKFMMLILPTEVVVRFGDVNREIPQLLYSYYQREAERSEDEFSSGA